MEEKKDNKKYNGWLISNSFWKRCLAVQGYQFVFTMVLYLILISIGLFIYFINPSFYNDDFSNNTTLIQELDDYCSIECFNKYGENSFYEFKFITIYDSICNCYNNETEELFVFEVGFD